jgi:hypothetical protein
MTPAVLLEHLVALHAKHGEAHRRMVDAVQTNDLLGLVTASQQQGALCTEQGALLADYIATVVSAMPDIDASYREQINELALQLREGSPSLAVGPASQTVSIAKLTSGS